MRCFLPVVVIASMFVSCAKGASGVDSEDPSQGAGGGSGSGGGSSGPSGGGEGNGCPTDKFEPNDSCSAAHKVGVVTDANDNAITLEGTLTDASDEDWFTFDSTDTDEGTGNSYHVSIAFSASTVEFAFDVVRGPMCLDPLPDHSNLTSYTWCVDGTSGDPDGGGVVGERDCGKFDGGTGKCTDHTSQYYVRVHRKSDYSGAGSCSTYQIKVTGKGGTKCDFTKNCDPPPSM